MKKFFLLTFLTLNITINHLLSMDNFRLSRQHDLIAELKKVNVNLESPCSDYKELIDTTKHLLEQVKNQKDLVTLYSHIAPLSLTKVNSFSLCSPEDTLTGFCSFQDDGYAIAFYNGIVKIFDRNHNLQQEVSTDGHTIYSMATLENGSLVTSSSNFTLKAWNVETGKEYCSMCPSSNGIGVVLPIDDHFCAVAFNDYTIRICNIIQSRVCSHQFQSNTGKVSSIKRYSDNNLVSGSLDGTVSIWNINTSKESNCFYCNDGAILSVAVLQNGFVAAGSRTGRIQIWNPKTNTCEMILNGHTKAIRSLLTLASGTLASIDDDSCIKLWNPITGECFSSLKIENRTKNISFIEKNNHLIAVFADGEMAFIDLYPRLINYFFESENIVSPHTFLLLAQLEKLKQLNQRTMINESWKVHFEDLPIELQNYYSSIIYGIINDCEPELSDHPLIFLGKQNWIECFFS